MLLLEVSNSLPLLLDCNLFTITQIHWNFLVRQLLETLIWRTRLRIVWLLDVIGYRPVTRKRVRKWSEGPSELEPRLDFLFPLGVDHLVELPQFFEALLRTVVARLQLHLDARWTLHGRWFAALRILAQSALHF